MFSSDNNMLAELKAQYDPTKYEIKNSFSVSRSLRSRCFKVRLEVSSAAP